MAKRRGYKKPSNCPDPFMALIDLGCAAALGTIVKHKVKRDYAKGHGPESAAAAGMVFGVGSFRRGGEGLINLGGLMGLNSALKEIEAERRAGTYYKKVPFVDKVSYKVTPKAEAVKKNLWREYCEDGTKYGIDPNDYQSADEYYDSLYEAMSADCVRTDVCCDAVPKQSDSQLQKQGLWRKHCSDGTAYGINPNDFQDPDSYEEAIGRAKCEKALGSATEVILKPEIKTDIEETPRWWKYCSDGTPYGLSPRDFNNPDDYEDAVKEAQEAEKTAIDQKKSTSD